MKIWESNKYFLLSVYILSVISISGCATTAAHRFSELNLGMTKAEVRKILGDPYLFRGAVMKPDGSTQESWEYTIYAPYQTGANVWTGNITMWVTFIDDKLIFYGKPGDFDSAKQRPDWVTEHTIINK